MKVNTKHFGIVEIDDNKIINFRNGIFGFNEYKEFAIVYELTDDGEIPIINWLQSLEDKNIAIPIMNPISILNEYNPIIEDELINQLGDCNESNVAFYTVINAKKDVEELFTNLKAPIIINTDTFLGVQVMVENDDYPIRFNIYEMLRNAKKNSKEVGEV
ncbi:MAG: hypothetical protein K0R15_2173 [Clostridiales bacterium]|jgi:flagellar assembly factor FliW|nr:hypothetical protein [Clostridiales bacterium]